MLLGRFGGPYWRTKVRAWGIFKGEYDPERETAKAAARREFAEETGWDPPPRLEPLGVFPVGSKKVIEAFAAAGDADPKTLESDTFVLEWPPRSGRTQTFPEIERCEWVRLDEARDRIVASQTPILDALAAQLGRPHG